MFRLIYNQSLSTILQFQLSNLCYKLVIKIKKAIYNITNNTREFTIYQKVYNINKSLEEFNKSVQSLIKNT